MCRGLGGGVLFEVGVEVEGVGVEDQAFGEFGGLEQRVKAGVVGDLEGDVCVASEDHGDFVFFAESKQLCVVGFGLNAFGTVGREGVVVNFKYSSCVFRGFNEGFEVEVGCAVAGVADDLDGGVLHYFNQSGCVFVDCASFPADVVYAGYAQVEQPEGLVGEVERAVVVENVYLAADHQPDAVHGARDDVYVAEVYLVAAAWYGGSVLGYAEYGEVFLRGCEGHFLQGAVGVA